MLDLFPLFQLVFRAVDAAKQAIYQLVAANEVASHAFSHFRQGDTAVFGKFYQFLGPEISGHFGGGGRLYVKRLRQVGDPYKMALL